jgi:hypothetical protein
LARTVAAGACPVAVPSARVIDLTSVLVPPPATTPTVLSLILGGVILVITTLLHLLIPVITVISNLS